MKAIASAFASFVLLALVGCASLPPMPPVADLLRDEFFEPPSVTIDPDDAMALSAPMRAYLDSRLRRAPPGVDRRAWLMEALYRRDELRLEYDASITRTAAQAFEARSGNCLALVLMTGAFAKAMGLSVRYQLVLAEAAFDRAGDLAISIGHVNLTLEERTRSPGFVTSDREPWTVDFMQPRAAARWRTLPLDEHTVVAMFLNNRAVEALVRGHTDDAYWWTRAALRRDPELLGAYITLGVIYRSRQQPALAEATLARVNAREPDNTHALANRILALGDLGRHREAGALRQRLDRLEPHPRFVDFDRGMAALRERRFEEARRFFERAVERSPDFHEFHFWLAITQAELGDASRATAHLHRAMETSTTRKAQAVYAGKLDRLKALRTR